MSVLKTYTPVNRTCIAGGRLDIGFDAETNVWFIVLREHQVTYWWNRKLDRWSFLIDVGSEVDCEESNFYFITFGEARRMAYLVPRGTKPRGSLIDRICTWARRLYLRLYGIRQWHFTTDGRRLAPHPNMTDADLFDFEQDMKIPNPTWPDLETFLREHP